MLHGQGLGCVLHGPALWADSSSGWNGSKAYVCAFGVQGSPVVSLRPGWDTLAVKTEQ